MLRRLRGHPDQETRTTPLDRTRRSTSRSRRPSRPATRPHPAAVRGRGPAPVGVLRRRGRDGRASRPVTVTLADGASFELDHGAVVIASITSCTNTSNPSVMLGAALLAKNAVDRGLTVKPWVKTSMAPGSQGRHRLLREGRPLAVPGEARLPPGRLRLHHLHRQLRAAARGDLGRGQRGRPRRGLGAVRQPQLRGPDQPGRQDELPGLARRWSSPTGSPARWTSTSRPSRWAPAPDGTEVYLRDIWPTAAGHPGHDRQLDHRGDVHQGLRGRLRRRRALEVAAHARGQDLRVGPGVDLRPQAPVLRGHAARPVAGHRHLRRPGAGQARRLGDHRPHLPRRRDQGRHPGRAVPGRARRGASATSTPTAPGAATTR